MWNIGKWKLRGPLSDDVVEQDKAKDLTLEQNRCSQK